MKKNLKIPVEVAITIYEEQNDEGKRLLERMWPDEFASKRPIIERIKTFADACKIKGLDVLTALPYPSPVNSFQEAINGTAQMMIIAEVLNEGWEPDFSNSNEYKYTPYFKWNTSGFGFSATDYANWAASTGVGSRLVFKSSELAEYAGTQFIDIYNKFLTKPINEKAAN